MTLTNEEINPKQWHWLAKILRWIFTVGVFYFSFRAYLIPYAIYSYDPNADTGCLLYGCPSLMLTIFSLLEPILPVLGFGLAMAFIAYYTFGRIYNKVINNN